MCSCGYRMTAANKCIKIEVPTTQATPPAPCKLEFLSTYDFVLIKNGFLKINFDFFSGRKQRLLKDIGWNFWR